jgi:hypothetical protein
MIWGYSEIGDNNKALTANGKNIVPIDSANGTINGTINCSGNGARLSKIIIRLLHVK